MLTELRRLHDLLGRRAYRQQPRPPRYGRNNIPRNYEEIIGFLEQYGILYSRKKKVAIISKEPYGDFYINLLDATVKFSPLTCLKCEDIQKCNKSQRKLCIVGDSEGFAVNVKVSRMDLLILSKIFAILYDLLPNHVLKQIENKSHCFTNELQFTTLDNCVDQDFNRIHNIIRAGNSTVARPPPIQGPIPPPQFPNLNLRFKLPSNQRKDLNESPNILELRHSMITELRRLKKLIRFSRKFESTF